jgi:hypothetical protein
MDSTDSYAATFLLATREAYRASSDLTKVKGLATGISQAIKAIEATQDVDGLTWAKPTWHVKYLMDQAETFAGLLAAVDLANLLKNSTLANRASADATRMRNGVAAIWNATPQAFDWAVHDTGARTPTDWTVLYSDALQQAWAAAFGLVDSTRASALMAKFNLSQPNWQFPAKTALFSGGSQSTVGYWPVAGFVLNALKSSTAASTAVANIRSAALASKRAWPFTTGNAGQLILLASGFSLPLLVATSPANRLQSSAGTRTFSSETVGTVVRRVGSTVTTAPTTPPTTARSAPPTTAAPPPTTTTTKPPLVQVPLPNGPTLTVPSP